MPQPCGGRVPTMSMLVKPAFCSWVHSRARQQPGEPVIESPSGMIRTGPAAVAGVGGRKITRATVTSTAVRIARQPDSLGIIDQLLSHASGRIWERSQNRRHIVNRASPTVSMMGAVGGNPRVAV